MRDSNDSKTTNVRSDESMSNNDKKKMKSMSTKEEKIRKTLFFYIIM